MRNIFDFPKHYPGTTIVTLEQNYRSTQPILAAANGVIGLASEQYSKELWSSKTSGELPQLVTVRDETDQAAFMKKLWDRTEVRVRVNTNVEVISRGTWEQIRAEAKNGIVRGNATTQFTFSDFGLSQPRVPILLSVADSIKLEYDFTLVPKT